MKTNSIFCFLLVVFALSACTVNYTLDLDSNESTIGGFSKTRLERIDEMATRYVETGKYAGIVTQVSRHGKVIHSAAVGQYGLENDKPIANDTLFRIYSMTKPITAVAAMILYEQGKFQMNDAVSKHLPEFENQKLLSAGQLVSPQSPMTMRQLFTHTAGLTYGFTPDNPVDLQYQDEQLLSSQNLQEFAIRLAKLPLRFEPGTRYHYSVSSDLLGAVIERLSGQPLDQFFSENIFQPLGMNDTFFAVPDDKLHRLAGIHLWDAKQNKMVAVPAASQRNYSSVSFFSGGGGLVSTVSDYQRFCELFIHHGRANGVRILGPKTVDFMTSDHLTPAVRAEGVGQYPSADLYPGQTMALGFGLITDPGIAPSISTKGEISWSGAAGTKFWIDPKEGIIGIAMVQLYRSPWPLRFDLKVATYQALIELDAHKNAD